MPNIVHTAATVAPGSDCAQPLNQSWCNHDKLAYIANARALDNLAVGIAGCYDPYITVLKMRVARWGLRCQRDKRASVCGLFVSPYLLYEVSQALTTDQVCDKYG